MVNDQYSQRNMIALIKQIKLWVESQGCLFRLGSFSTLRCRLSIARGPWQRIIAPREAIQTGLPHTDCSPGFSRSCSCNDSPRRLLLTSESNRWRFSWPRWNRKRWAALSCQSPSATSISDFHALWLPKELKATCSEETGWPQKRSCNRTHNQAQRPWSNPGLIFLPSSPWRIECDWVWRLKTGFPRLEIWLIFFYWT